MKLQSMLSLLLLLLLLLLNVSLSALLRAWRALRLRVDIWWDGMDALGLDASPCDLEQSGEGLLSGRTGGHTPRREREKRSGEKRRYATRGVRAAAANQPCRQAQHGASAERSLHDGLRPLASAEEHWAQDCTKALARLQLQLSRTSASVVSAAVSRPSF